MASPLALLKKGSRSLHIDLPYPTRRAPAPPVHPFWQPRPRLAVLLGALLRAGMACWMLSDER